MQDNISNEKRLIGLPEIIEINTTNFVFINEFQKRNSEFYEIIFYNNGKEIFLGKFVKDYGKISVKYNNGKILIFVGNSNTDEITNVLGLYDILDDTFYSLTEEMAIKKFDSSISVEFLKNKDNLTAREDIEKKQKVKSRLN